MVLKPMRMSIDHFVERRTLGIHTSTDHSRPHMPTSARRSRRSTPFEAKVPIRFHRTQAVWLLELIVLLETALAVPHAMEDRCSDIGSFACLG